MKSQGLQHWFQSNASLTAAQNEQPLMQSCWAYKAVHWQSKVESIHTWVKLSDEYVALSQVMMSAGCKLILGQRKIAHLTTQQRTL